MADLPEGQKLSLLQGTETCPNQILLFGSTKEASCRAFVTSYLHYFPSPTSGLCIPLLSPSSQQNYHFFFSPSLSHPQGETHTPPFTLSTIMELRIQYFFTFLSPSLPSNSLGARTSVSSGIKHQKSSGSESVC